MEAPARARAGAPRNESTGGYEMISRRNLRVTFVTDGATAKRHRVAREQQCQHLIKLLSETCAAMQDCVPYSGIPGRRRHRMNERTESPAGSASQFNGNVFESSGGSPASNNL